MNISTRSVPRSGWSRISPIGTPAMHERDEQPAAVEVTPVQRAVAGEHEDHEELGQLTRLELERADVEPGLRALDLHADAEHRDEHEHGDRVAEQRELAEPAVVDDRHDHHRDDAEDDRDGLALDERQRIVAGVLRAACASPSRSSAARDRR